MHDQSWNRKMLHSCSISCLFEMFVCFVLFCFVFCFLTSVPTIVGLLDVVRNEMRPPSPAHNARQGYFVEIVCTFGWLDKRVKVSQFFSLFRLWRTSSCLWDLWFLMPRPHVSGYFEKGDFFLHFSLTPTRKRRFRAPKTLSRVDFFKNASLSYEDGSFEYDDVMDRVQSIPVRVLPREDRKLASLLLGLLSSLKC